MIDHIGFIQILIVVALMAALYLARRTLAQLRQLPPRASSTVDEGRYRHRLVLLELTELSLAAVFFLVGGAKLVGRHDMILLFQEIGVGQWLRYVTGAVEVTGAALLIVPMLPSASALVLGALMIVATLVELLVLHRPPIAALACLSGHTFVVWARMSQPRQPWLRLSAPRRSFRWE